MMPTRNGELLGHLPAIYQSSGDLRALLEVLEAVLLEDAGGNGLAQKIASISFLFSPLFSPCSPQSYFGQETEQTRALLEWLSTWVALSHTRQLSEENLRRLIADSISLYTRRGTKEYLHKILQYFIPEYIVIGMDDIQDQDLQSLTVGHSRVGFDSLLGGDKPYHFQVLVRFVDVPDDPEERKIIRRRSEAIIRTVVDLAKPAHTTYQLIWREETIQEGFG